MTSKQPARIHRRSRLAVALVGVSLASLALGGCKTTTERDITTASIPSDYRQRHPIVIQESNRSVEIFVGQQRGGLSGPQRADVAALAQTWLRDGTGSIIAEVPTDTPNARAAADSMREVQSILVGSGIPPRGIIVRGYRPADARQLATLRLTYPRIVADAGPCGTWPEDLGPSVHNKSYLDNKPYFNLGCAQQRNLAAMISNPSDLVQPRPEAPAYTGRRTVVLDKYRKGESTAAINPDADKNKISNVGQ
ncbi:MAG: pilus assembly protein CpaD [Tardiphaga sp.]|jgi:pilus assembly protein CpaD|uniref:CpaD family pilus assembly protein n=1 Tax=Tardiphaga sp. TaxID=1926292 RepID=UPI002627C328|nr:CpaD family pilus assembly protein [Tardiphaga sp.]MDB5504583.1 pilus assembly protein CpaD [Tardiphaga sp.]